MDLKPLPLVSIIAVTYNHSSYIEEAIKSLLNQTYSPLEIIISDDNSTDDTFIKAQNFIRQYQGPHKVILNRNNKNLGIGGNVSAAIQLSNGSLLVSADCDDISEPNRISELMTIWQSLNPKPNLLTSDAWDTTQEGQDLDVKICHNLEEIKSTKDWLKKNPIFFGCTNIYTRDLIIKFGLVSNECGATDQIMVLRSILMGGALSVHKSLVHHRQNGVTGNKPKNISAKIDRLIKDSSRTIADIEQHIKDAKILGQGAIIEAHFKNKLSEAKLIPKIFSAVTLKEKIKVFFADQNTPLNKKIRLLSYAIMPELHESLFKIKNLIRFE